MEQTIQEYNSSQNLLEWSERVSACRNSGKSVREWCKENGIALSTYYHQQRKVYEAIKTAAGKETPTEFAEISITAQRKVPAVTIRIGEAEADIYAGADEATVRAVCRALKTC